MIPWQLLGGLVICFPLALRIITIPLRCSLGEHFHSREFSHFFFSFSLKSTRVVLVFWTVCLAGFHIPSVGSFLGNLVVDISVTHLALATVCEVAVSESTWLAASLKLGGFSVQTRRSWGLWIRFDHTDIL